MFNEMYTHYLKEYATMSCSGNDDNIMKRANIEGIATGTPMNVMGPAVSNKMPKGLFPQGKRKQLKKKKKRL